MEIPKSVGEARKNIAVWACLGYFFARAKKNTNVDDETGYMVQSFSLNFCSDIPILLL